MEYQREWESDYKAGKPPWDTGFPSRELIRVVDGGKIAPCRTLELGCGTGTNAVYLARQGFDVTAMDFVGMAIKEARAKAEAAGVKVRFLEMSVLNAPSLGETFDFVFDRGCFHTFQGKDNPKYVEMLSKATRPGSLYLMLCGNAKEPSDLGPPVLSEKQIRDSLSPLFDFEWLREFRFSTTEGSEGPLAWSCLMRRR